MGCIFSTVEAPQPAAALAPRQQAEPEKKPAAATADPYAAVKRLDPADFRFVGLKGQVCIKEPGSINGINFKLKDLDDCDVFLFDHTSQVLIDNCTNCRFFIGPCEGSVFFRNCSDCKFVVSCGQLRTRDSRNIDISIFCNSRPTIEKTSNITFSCLQLSYFTMAANFKKVGHKVWNNKWSDVFDFNESGGKHFKIAANVDTKSLLNLSLLEGKLTTMSPGELDAPSTVPLTSGLLESRQPRAMIFCFGEAMALALLNEVQASTTVEQTLVRTAQSSLDSKQIESLFGSHKSAEAGKDAIVGFEFVDTPELAALVQRVPGAYTSSRVSQDYNLFFIQFQPKVT
jgi:protein XRP2